MSDRLFPHGLNVIVDLWRGFSAMQFDECGNALSDFMHFPAGTKYSEICDWFDCRYPGGCMELDAIIERK